MKFKLKKIVSYICAMAFFSVNLNLSSFNHLTANATELAPGKYVATLLRSSSNKLLTTAKYTAGTNKFLPTAVIEVKEDSTVSMTVGIQNWSLYDSFINLNQKYNDSYSYNNSKYVPKEWVEKLTLTYEDEFLENNPSSIVEVESGYLNYENTVEYDSSTDVGYVTFNIDDYTKPVWTLQWFNTPIAANNTNYAQMHSATYLWVDVNSMESVENINQAIDDGTATFTLRAGESATRAAHSTNNATTPQYVSDLFLFDDVYGLNEANLFSISKTESGAEVNIYINDSDSFYPNFSAPYNFKTINRKSYNDLRTYESWGTYLDDSTTVFNDISKNISTDENGNSKTYLNLEYSEKELLYGKMLLYNADNVSTNQTGAYDVYICVTCQEPAENFELSYSDENEGITFTVTASTLVLPKDSRLIAVKNDKKFDWVYNTSVYEKGVWYTLSFVDGNNNNIEVDNKAILGVKVNLPDWYSSDKCKLDPKDSTMRSQPIHEGFDYVDEDNAIWTRKLDNVSGWTYAILQYSDTVNPYQLDNGIYSIDAFLMKDPSNGVYSMANACIDNSAYIVKNGSDINFYFKAMSSDGDYSEDSFYMGEFHLAGTDDNGNLLWDNTSYTRWLTDSNGELVSNANYDPITEYADLLGGIIKLDENSWLNEFSCFGMTVQSPVMAAMNNLSYEEVKDDELGVKLVFKSPRLISSDTSETSINENIIKNGYGYDSSALLRKIKQTENQFAATLEDEAIQKVLKHAEEVYTATYDTLAKASNAYEAEINTLTDFAENYDANNYLSDGKYTITGKMVMADGSDKTSMSDAAVNHTVVLNVKDGKYTAELEFKPIDVNGTEGKLQNLWYYTDYTINANGTVTGKAKEEATVAAKYDDGYPHYLDIELINKANYEYDYIPLHVYVPAMTGSEDQDVYLVLDWSTLAKADDISALNGQSLTLPGVELPGFGLNFFMDFSAQTLADDGAKVVFTLPDGSTAEQLISESTKTENGYKFTALVNAKEMTAPVKAQVVLSNGETGETYSCSVKKYADELLAMDGISEKTVNLVNALLNYGGYAQEYFGYETSDLANAGVPAMAAVSDADLEDYEMTVSGTADGIEYYGSSLVLENSTAMNIYFKLADGKKATDFTFKAGKTTLTPTETGNGLCYVTVSGISAADLSAETTVSVGKLKVISSPYSYVYTALTKSQKEKLLNITKALYLYGEAAAAYVG